MVRKASLGLECCPRRRQNKDITTENREEEEDQFLRAWSNNNVVWQNFKTVKFSMKFTDGVPQLRDSSHGKVTMDAPKQQRWLNGGSNLARGRRAPYN